MPRRFAFLLFPKRFLLFVITLMGRLLSASFENLSRINLRFADAAGGVASGYELVSGAGEVLLVCV